MMFGVSRGVSASDSVAVRVSDGHARAGLRDAGERLLGAVASWHEQRQQAQVRPSVSALGFRIHDPPSPPQDSEPSLSVVLVGAGSRRKEVQLRSSVPCAPIPPTKVP